MKTRQPILRLTMAALCLALCLVLPFLTGQIPEIGGMLCPMHLPVLLCGFLAGPLWAAGVGLTAPLLRFVLFGMPPLFPTGVAMCLELAVYGLVSGLMYARLPVRTSSVYLSLITAMVAGRIAWGIAQALLLGMSGSAFTWGMFIAGAVTNALPGIILQLVVIPPLVVALERALPTGKS